MRRGAAAVSGALLVASTALWIAGTRRVDDLAYRWGWWEQVTAPPGSLLSWSFAAQSVGVTNGPRRVVLRRDRYTSYATTKENLESWKTWGGWEHVSATAGAVRPTDVPGTYMNTWDDFGVLGFRVYPATKQGTECRLVDIPHWMPVAGTAGALVLLVRPDVRRRLRKQRGACLACGYDRGGLDPSAPCPECNTPVPTRP